MKRQNIKHFYVDFAEKLKKSDPKKYFQVVKTLSNYNGKNNQNEVEELIGISPPIAADKIAKHFSSVSSQYSPVNLTSLPSFLPSLPPPKISEVDIFRKMQRLNNTQSTYPQDFPWKLRKEYDIFLLLPLKDIFNTCLEQQTYPKQWKLEYVTPLLKSSNAKKNISDLRKIAKTSENSKLFESFLKDWILEDISENLDKKQFGARKGSGTEHLIVQFIDRILNLLDGKISKTAVMASSIDWTSAFDRVDPTITALRFVSLGIRPSLIPILISYMSERRMIVKYKGSESEPKDLVGGGPQGTLLGGIQYIIANDDCGKTQIDENDRFKYYDDLEILEFIILMEKLKDYDFHEHVASDIGVDHLFLPPRSYKMQSHLENISQWTNDNLMKLNELKCNYIIFSRTK